MTGNKLKSLLSRAWDAAAERSYFDDGHRWCACGRCSVVSCGQDCSKMPPPDFDDFLKNEGLA